MSSAESTRERILEASRVLFNEKGYKATTLAEIAASIGIAQGNLTYHFPTKGKLVEALEERARQAARERLARPRHGTIANRYVELLFSAMNETWEIRFLLRDHAQFCKASQVGDAQAGTRLDPDMAADHEAILEGLKAMQKEGLFRRDMPVDLRVLSRALFIVSRYWMDHLQEFEGLDRIKLADRERGVRHHFAVLLPYLTASARRDLEAAALEISTRLAIQEDELSSQA